MFKAGEVYEIQVAEFGPDGIGSTRGIYRIAEFKGTLLKVTNSYDGKDAEIINVASPYFLSAKLQPREKSRPRGRAKKKDEFFDD